MRLRTSLLLGYGYLVGLLLLSSASAIVGFHSLSRGIDSILKENFSSVRAAMQMVEAIERHDSATLGQLLDPAFDPQAATEAERNFSAALERARANVTIEQERPLLDKVQRDFETYRRERTRLLASRPDHPLAAYRKATFQAFEQVKGGLMEVLELNHQAMRAADSEARRTAVRSGVWLGVLVLLALFSLVVLSRWLHQRLLLRLDELAEATEAIAAGDVRRRLPVAASDELGRIATRLNQGLDAHQELRAEMAGRLSQERQLTLALFDAFGAGRIVLDLGGKVIIQDSAPIDPGVLAAVEAWIRARGQPILIDPAGLAELSDPVRIDSESGACYLQLLTARDKRPIGWLARAQESERVAAQATSS